jgi:hypothetical protein
MKVFAPSVLRLLVSTILVAAPIAAPAQAPGSDYTAAYPSVETVESHIKGTDPTDTLARQVAVFRMLRNDINNTKYARTIRGPFTPGEQKMIQAYGAAEAELIQAFTKSHTPEEVTAFNRLAGRYVFNNDVYNDYHRLIGQQGQDASRAADAKTHDDAERIRERMNPSPNSGTAASRSTGSNEPSGAAFINSMFENDPEIRRCLELGGGTPDDCARAGTKGMGSSAQVAVGRLIGVDVTAGHVKNGVMLVGVYHSRADLPGLELTADGQAVLTKCGTLVDDNHPYTLRSAGGATQLVLANEPSPIVLTVRPDGSLAGPGVVPVKGRIITGYNTTTSTATVNGVRADVQGYYCNGPCSKTTSTPVYGPSLQRCTIAQLAPQPPPPPPQKPTGLAGMFGDLLDMATPEAVTYGYRMAGVYASSTGLKIEFTNRLATLDCGKAHVNAPYTVENTSAGFVVRVQNPASPLVLAFAPDNTLRGSGSATINGRLISSFHGDNVTYTPHSETCSVGTFVATGKQGS